MRTLVPVPAVVLLAATGLHASAGAYPSASRVVDRTFICTANVFGGIRELDLWASPPRKIPPSAGGGTTSAFLVVGSGSFSQRLVFVFARGNRFYAAERAGVYAHARRCRESRASVPLSATGLPGPPTRWDTNATCPVRGRVLVRVRATLQSVSSWGRAGEYVGVRRNVVAATLAARDQATEGPMALMRMDSAGKTAFWSSSRCG